MRAARCYCALATTMKFRESVPNCHGCSEESHEASVDRRRALRGVAAPARLESEYALLAGSNLARAGISRRQSEPAGQPALDGGRRQEALPAGMRRMSRQ